MIKNPQGEPDQPDDTSIPDPLSHRMALERTLELADKSVRSAQDVSEFAREEARRNSMTNPSLSPKETPGPSEHKEQMLGLDVRIEQAELRTERAEARTEQAKSRTEQAEIRTEQAETRTEEAKTRTEQAETRTEQAEIRAEQAETRSEQAIRASELSYRRLFEAAKDGILILETDTGRISDVNPFLIELLGLSHAELVGKPIWELGPFRDIVSNKAKFEQLQEQGYVLSDDLPMEAKGGRKIAVEFVSNVYQVGSVNVIQCNVRDITERKRIEEKIRGMNVELEHCVAKRTEELRTANAELEAFSYSVSHDLRAPVRHVMAFAELLLKESEMAFSEKSLARITKILHSAKHMGNMIDDLLSFARIGRTELKKTEVNFNELIRDTLTDFQTETKERNISWEIQQLPMARVDRALLRLVLVNLISNAIKFTSARFAAKIEIGCISGGNEEIVIYIRDNGAGFDQKYVSKLFGVFQRLHSHAEFEGTGIGLANVQRIIHRHGGRTWAEGIVDGGATFYFSVPALNHPIA